MKVGFIGLGNMGRPMAENLRAAGHAVTGFDTMPVEASFPLAPSAADAAADAEVVVTMLPSGPILRTVAAEVIPAMMKGSVLLDCSTVDVESARAVADAAEGAGLGVLDAPVSGGTGGAAAGTLTFMVGGDEGALGKAAPLLDAMGMRTIHCGRAGAGQAAKICNNMILGATMAATCEAFHLADRLGLDRRAVFDVVSTSSGQSWSMTTYCPAPGVGPDSPADHDYQPGFAAGLMLKDLRLALEAAEASGATLQIGTEAARVFERFAEAEGRADKDFSALLPGLNGEL